MKDRAARRDVASRAPPVQRGGPAGELAVVLKPGKEKSLRRRHPWVYATAISHVTGEPVSGATVAVRAADGTWLAWAAYSPASSIRARAWSFDERDRIDAAWMRARVQTAVEARSTLAASGNALRLVFGESDRLPGLIVDRYGDQLVTQFQGAGVDAWREALVEALVEATGCANVFDRSDGATRAREGLPPISGVLRGAEPPEMIEIAEHGLRFLVDVRHGHKTGYYIDQRDNRRLARELARGFVEQHGRGPLALNCFCYTGGFSVAMLAGGAAMVHSIDSSAEALRVAKAHIELNGLPAGAAEWDGGDAFDALRSLKSQAAQFDLIVLDPPKFASSHHHVERAARAYKDINLNALKLLAPGGNLLTFSCSGAIDVDLFQKIVAGAVIDSGVEAWLVQRLAAASDHPLMMTVPESEYLKGVWLRRVR
jgi:23S rRNA (cytosine1962-C5)-methyltransferase